MNRSQLAWVFLAIFVIAPVVAAFLYAVSNSFWVVPATLGIVSLVVAYFLGANE